MAQKIREYRATEVALHPSNEGYSATELAARRVGAFSTQTAAGEREAAQVKAQGSRAAGALVETFSRFAGLEAKLQPRGLTVRGGKAETTMEGNGTEDEGQRQARQAAAPKGPPSLEDMTAEDVKRITAENAAKAQIAKAQTPTSDVEGTGDTAVLRGQTPSITTLGQMSPGAVKLTQDGQRFVQAMGPNAPGTNGVVSIIRGGGGRQVQIMNPETGKPYTTEQENVQGWKLDNPTDEAVDKWAGGGDTHGPNFGQGVPGGVSDWYQQQNNSTPGAIKDWAENSNIFVDATAAQSTNTPYQYDQPGSLVNQSDPTGAPPPAPPSAIGNAVSAAGNAIVNATTTLGSDLWSNF
jgi:hypothetical protein